MSYTANELFTSWYSKYIGKDLTSEEVELRRKAIAEILKVDDHLKWISAIQTYLGIIKPGDQLYEDIVALVKSDDINFLIQDQNLVRVMIGCAIAEKMDKNDSYICDFLALSLKTADVTETFDPPVKEIIQRAFQFLVDESESRREIESIGTIPTITLSGKVNIPQLDGTNQTDFSAALIKAMTALQKDVASLNSTLTASKNHLQSSSNNCSILSEELNILWWLFREHSDTIDVSFRECSPETLSVLVAIELSDLTTELPTLGASESIINKALSHSAHEFGGLLSHEAIIDAVGFNREQIRAVLPFRLGLEQLTPILYAIKCRLDYSGAEWQTVYNNHCNTSLSKTTNLEAFSSQLYNELMLIKVFDKISK